MAKKSKKWGKIGAPKSEKRKKWLASIRKKRTGTTTSTRKGKKKAKRKRKGATKTYSPTW